MKLDTERQQDTLRMHNKFCTIPPIGGTKTNKQKNIITLQLNDSLSWKLVYIIFGERPNISSQQNFVKITLKVVL